MPTKHRTYPIFSHVSSYSNSSKSLKIHGMCWPHPATLPSQGTGSAKPGGARIINDPLGGTVNEGISSMLTTPAMTWCDKQLNALDMKLAWCYNYLFSTYRWLYPLRRPDGLSPGSLAPITKGSTSARLKDQRKKASQWQARRHTPKSVLNIIAYHGMNSAATAMHSFFGASGCQDDKH